MSIRSVPTAVLLHPRIWPEKPWQRLHMDFASPFQGRMFFVLVDAHSKWPEVVPISSTSLASSPGPSIRGRRTWYSLFARMCQIIHKFHRKIFWVLKQTWQNTQGSKAVQVYSVHLGTMKISQAYRGVQSSEPKTEVSCPSSEALTKLTRLVLVIVPLHRQHFFCFQVPVTTPYILTMTTKLLTKGPERAMLSDPIARTPSYEQEHECLSRLKVKVRYRAGNE